MRILATLTLFAAVAAAPAFALNPQPEPPGIPRVTLGDGSLAFLGADHRVYRMAHGRRVYLPPGPCRLRDGSTIRIGPGGRFDDPGHKFAGRPR